MTPVCRTQALEDASFRSLNTNVTLARFLFTVLCLLLHVFTDIYLGEGEGGEES